MSCPARMAFSSCGTTVSSKPRMPGVSDAPAAIAFCVFRRISSATDNDSQPEARRSASAVGRSLGGFMAPGGGSRRDRRKKGQAWVKPKPRTCRAARRRPLRRP